MSIDLKREHKASLERPRYGYSLAAKGFFLSMDLITGKTMTLSKVKLIEMLASIPYRSWEIRQYAPTDAMLPKFRRRQGSTRYHDLGA